MDAKNVVCFLTMFVVLATGQQLFSPTSGENSLVMSSCRLALLSSRLEMMSCDCFLTYSWERL